MILKNRIDAGERLADLLTKYIDDDLVVYALPRGGVVLGDIIAKRLQAPLDLAFVKKIGHPMNREYALCAVVEDGDTSCNDIEIASFSKNWLNGVIIDAKVEMKRQRETYLKGKEYINPKDKVVIIVDDGIATGLSMIVTLKNMRKKEPKKIVVAIPVCPLEEAKKLESLCDELVCLQVDPYYLGAVSMYYEDFQQVEDKEVIRILQERR